ncbi:MAG TPA: hypothetical protein VK419_07590 [Bryobacteraceae bacterium]|nr:hypothetical protein [Bryobacteraceae bacterium]
MAVMAVAFLPIKAQSFSAVYVHLPYTVMFGTRQLSPGDYTLRPLHGAPGFFTVYNGMTFETLLHAMPAEKLYSAPQTELVLRGNGREYVLDKMWIAGETGGYHFVTPESIKSRERERRAAIEIPATKIG